MRSLRQDASLMFLQEGDDVSVEQLMQGMAVPSASDAAVAGFSQAET